jgi:hypothetical protein
MRIALIYPPPWKIAAPGENVDAHGDGPPTGYREDDLDADFYQTPYGLFSLGAQAIRAGHQVKISISLRTLVRSRGAAARRGLRHVLPTANCRGVAPACAIRAHHLRAHHRRISAREPLAKEMLAHYPRSTRSRSARASTLIEPIAAPPVALRGLARRVYRDGEIAGLRDAVVIRRRAGVAADYFTQYRDDAAAAPVHLCGAETTYRGFRGQSVPTCSTPSSVWGRRVKMSRSRTTPSPRTESACSSSAAASANESSISCGAATRA